MSRKKPLRPQHRRPSDSFTAVEYEGTKLRIYSNGILTIDGDTKHAAFALAKRVLDEVGGAVGMEYNRCVTIKCKPGTPYTIEWIGLGILSDDKLPEPKFWEEFKAEFERVCNLKAFI